MRNVSDKGWYQIEDNKKTQFLRKKPAYYRSLLNRTLVNETLTFS